MPETYGATAATVAGEFPGVDLSTLTTQIEAWLLEYGAVADAYLRRVGYSPATISSAGVSDGLCLLARGYLLHATSARLASALTLQGAALEKSQYHTEEAKRIEERIRALPETVSPSWDQNEQSGSFRSNVRFDGSRRGQSLPRRVGRFIRGMST